MGVYLSSTDAAWDVFVATGESVVDGFAAVAVNAEQMDFTMPFADPTALVPVRRILMECVFVVGDSQAVSSVYRMAADSTPSGADWTSILPSASVPDSDAYIPARSMERVFVAHPASSVVAQIVASANIFMFCFLSVSSYGLAQTAKRQRDKQQTQLRSLRETDSFNDLPVIGKCVLITMPVRPAKEAECRPFDVGFPPRDAEGDLQIAEEVVRVGADRLEVAAGIQVVMHQCRVEARHLQRRSAEPLEPCGD